MSQRRRTARLRSGHVLFGAFASTIRVLRWLLAGLLAVYLGSGITRVAPNEDALIYRLGRLQPEVHPPGLLFALPAPIDRVVRVPTRTQHEIFLRAWAPDEDSVVFFGGAPSGPLPAANSVTGTAVGAAMTSDMAAAADLPKPPGPGLHPYHHGYTTTGDVNLVQARLIARYRIVDPVSYLGAASPGDMARLIESTLYDSATRTLAGMKIDDTLGSGLEFLRQQVIDLAQQRFDHLKLGIQLVAFEVNTLTPPEATVAAFAEVTSAQVESRTLVENARTYSARVLPRAKSDAFRIRSQAESDAKQLVTRAAAEAGSFLALAREEQADSAIIRSRLHAETMETVFPQIKTTTVLPSDDGIVDLYLPANP